MSLQCIFEHNDYNLFCNSLSANNIIGNHLINNIDNEGSGVGVFDQTITAEGVQTAYFKSLVAGSGVTIDSASDHLTISANGSGSPVQSVFGRTGTVVAATNDYNINQLAGVAISSPASGNILRYNGTNFVNIDPTQLNYAYYVTNNATSTSITAVPNTYYYLNFGGTVTIPNTFQVGQHVLVQSNGNAATVVFGGTSFLNYGGGTSGANPTITVTSALAEFICTFNSGQVYYNLVRTVGQVLINGVGFPQNPGLGNLSNVVLTSPVNNDLLAYNGTNWVNQLINNPIASTFIIYVDKSGNDSTGNGSVNNPYLTISNAVAQITFATSAQRAQIKVGPGDYSNNFSMKANIGIVGSNAITTRITGIVDLNDPSWNNANDNRSSFQSITLGSAETFDFTVQSATSGKLYFYGCRFNNTVTTIGFNSINQIDFEYSLFFNSYTQTGITSTFEACSLYGGTITANSSTITSNPTNITFYSGGTSGNLVGTYTSTNPVAVTLVGFGVMGSISISGSQCTLSATSDSIPIGGVTLASGATLSYLNDTHSLQYTATTPSKWASPSVMSLQSAIDRIAAVVGNITPIP